MTDTNSDSDLTILKKSNTEVPASPDEARLEAFANKNPGRAYTVTFDCPEFTSMCPITGQPDFGHLTIEYQPADLCLESKALKIYLFSFRDHGAFHEEVVNRVLSDIVEMIKPRSATVTGDFNPRGGIAINVRASYPDT